MHINLVNFPLASNPLNFDSKIVISIVDTVKGLWYHGLFVGSIDHYYFTCGGVILKRVVYQ